MASEIGESHWIAVEAALESATIWLMHENACLTTSSAPFSGTASLSDITALLDPSWPADLPIYAAGLGSRSVKLPAKVMELPCEVLSHAGRQIHLVPSLYQEAPAALLQADVAKVAGFLSLNPNWDGVICIPGASHSHWVLVSANEIISIQSALTPTLAASLGAPAPQLDVPVEAVQDSLSKPEHIAARFGEISARQRMGLNTWEQSTAQIWAHLLGAELASTRPYWLGQNLALIAPKDQQAAYQTAFEAQYLPVTVAEPTQMILRGLKQICGR